MDLASQKRVLRSEVRKAEKLLSGEYKSASTVDISARLLTLEEYQGSRTVFCFVGAEREIDTKGDTP